MADEQLKMYRDLAESTPNLYNGYLLAQAAKSQVCVIIMSLPFDAVFEQSVGDLHAAMDCLDRILESSTPSYIEIALAQERSAHLIFKMTNSRRIYEMQMEKTRQAYESCHILAKFPPTLSRSISVQQQVLSPYDDSRMLPDAENNQLVGQAVSVIQREKVPEAAALRLVQMLMTSANARYCAIALCDSDSDKVRLAIA